MNHFCSSHPRDARERYNFSKDFGLKRKKTKSSLIFKLFENLSEKALSRHSCGDGEWSEFSFTSSFHSWKNEREKNSDEKIFLFDLRLGEATRRI